jgi:hypothetical protein
MVFLAQPPPRCLAPSGSDTTRATADYNQIELVLHTGIASSESC